MLLAGLPRPGGDRLGVHAATEAMRQRHRLLRPGGFILTNRATWTVDAVRALGTTTDIVTAAAVIGIGRTTAYQLAGSYPTSRSTPQRRPPPACSASDTSKPSVEPTPA